MVPPVHTSFVAIILAVMGLYISAVFASTPQTLPTQSITVCGQKLELEVASTDQQRQIGLMYRTGIYKGKGMLFIFERAQVLNFWMKNVPFDIDIGFFDSKGKFLNHTTMKGTSPMMLESALPNYQSRAPALYAVEVQKGFFNSVTTQNCVLNPLPQAQKKP